MRERNQRFWLSESEEELVQEWMALGDDARDQVMAAGASRGAFIDPRGNLGRIGDLMSKTFSEPLAPEQDQVLARLCALTRERGSIVFQALIGWTQDRRAALDRFQQMGSEKISG